MIIKLFPFDRRLINQGKWSILLIMLFAYTNKKPNHTLLVVNNIK